MARKNKNKKNEWDGVKASRAAARAAHFANGGTLATGRGRPARFPDRKARANKLACRRPVEG